MLNQIAISFDTTGSMASCLGLVRKNVEQLVSQLFSDIPELEMSVIAHGDYCDGPNWLSQLDLTDNQNAICKFVRNAPATGGGDAPEAYEAVLAQAQNLNWKKNANKVFVLIGDDRPHEAGYSLNISKFDWNKEAKALYARKGVSIYPVQCLGRSHATSFYEKLAEIGSGVKLDLNQFAIISDLLKAICYSQASKLDIFEGELKARKTFIDISLLQNIDLLAGRKARSRKRNENSLHAVPPGRFQIIPVHENIPIKNFVEENGLVFKQGKGFYELTKPVLVQEYKQVIVQDKETCDMFSGDKAREILGIPVGTRAKVKPTYLEKYRGFIQSTSNNRKLLAGTSFLYEV